MQFSIILPVYNVKNYLQECVDSVLCQSFSDYEIILVDDGSQDGSSELCDKLAIEHDCIRVIHKENGGAADCRNVGLRHAKGEYIVFIDSDDFITDESFLEQINLQLTQPVDMVLYKYRKYDDNSSKFSDCSFSYEKCLHFFVRLWYNTP